MHRGAPCENDTSGQRHKIARPGREPRSCLMRFRNLNLVANAGAQIYLSARPQPPNFSTLGDRSEVRFAIWSILGDFRKYSKSTPNRPEMKLRPSPIDFSTSLTLLRWPTGLSQEKKKNRGANFFVSKSNSDAPRG